MNEDPSVGKHRLWVNLLKYLLGPLAAAAGAIFTATYQHREVKEQTVQVKQEAAHVADTAYKTLRAPTETHKDEIKVLRDDLAKLAKTVEDLGKLAAPPAPVAPRRRRALVRQVQANAAKNLQAIKERPPLPVQAPLPESIPASPPKDASP
jgi:hypothetical protein